MSILKNITLKKSQIAKIIGISPQRLYNYIHGKRRMPPEIAHKIARYLSEKTGKKITLEDIYGLKQDNEAA